MYYGYNLDPKSLLYTLKHTSTADTHRSTSDHNNQIWIEMSLGYGFRKSIYLFCTAENPTTLFKALGTKNWLTKNSQYPSPATGRVIWNLINVPTRMNIY